MKSIIDFNHTEYFEPIKGMKAKLVHTKNQTYAFWEIDKGIILPEHSHVHEQVSIVTEGELELTIEGETTILKKGMIAFIRSNAKHSAKALTNVQLTDIFTPVREDFPYNS